MKPIFGILAAVLFGSLLIVYLFRGFGSDETGALFRSSETPVPVSYFKSPETSVRRINILLENKDWKILTQFYDLAESGVSKTQLLDGSFFFNASSTAVNGDLRNYLHPFPPGAKFLDVRARDEDDLFEVDVVWKMDLPWARDQEHVTTFVLRRFPEGYRLRPARVITQPIGTAPLEE